MKSQKMKFFGNSKNRGFSSKIILMLIILTACQLAPTQRPILPLIYTGTEAVEARFGPETQMQVYSGQQVNAVVELNNKGVYDVTNGKYALIFEEQYVQLLPGMQKTGAFTLGGKTQYNPEGDFTRIPIRMRSKELPPQAESYQTQIIFQSCYPYKTYASAQVCIDPDIANRNLRKACTAMPVSLGGGQGAPVAVTRIEPIMAPEGNDVRPVFAIYLQNLGSGQVLSTDAISTACGGVGAIKFNKVSVSAKLQDETLLCAPNPAILEAGQEARVICESRQRYGITAGTFTTILTTELDYGYMTVASNPLMISRLH